MTIQTNTAKINNAGITVAYTDNSGAAVTQNISFANKTTSLDSGLNVAAGDAALSGALAVTGATNLNAALNVAGAAALHNTLLVDGAATANNSVSVAGAANAANVMNVAGATAIHSTLLVDQPVNYGSTLTAAGAAALNSTLAVSGVTNLNNTVNVAGVTNLNSALNVANGASLNSSMDVIGAAHMHNTLLVDGVMAQPTLTAYNGSVPLDDAHVTYTIYNVISGAITVPQDADGAQLMSLSFYGTGATNAGGWAKVYFNIPVPGMDGIWYGATSNQMVTFDFTFGGSSSYTLTGGQTINAYLSCLEGWRVFNAVRNPDGSLAMKITYKKAAGVGAAAVNLGNTLTVAGASVFNNNLTVNGTAALNGAITISGALGMGGSGNVAGAATMSSTLDATGAAHLKNTLQVDGAARMGGSLALTSAANLGNALNVTGASALHNTLSLDGAASMGSTLNVAGVSNLNNALNVAGAAALGSTLGVTGAATMANTLAVAGASNLANVLNVTGASHLSSSLVADGAASMGSTLAVTGAANMGSALNVTGAAALSNTLAVTGAATMANTLGVVGAATMGSSLNVTGVSNVNSTLAVTGAATFQNNVVVNGNMTVLGNQTAIDTVSLQVKDNAVLIGDGNVADTLESGLMIQYKPSGASAPKYAGVKRRPATNNGGGEFVFFKDADSQISESGSSSGSGSSSQIYTAAAPSTVAAGPLNYFKFESDGPNSILDSGSANISATVTGTASYVNGIVGANALNLVNTAGGAPTNYIRGAISNYPNFSVSGWFNFQSLPSSGTSSIFGMGHWGGTYFDVYYAAGSGLIIGFYNTSNVFTVIGQSASISANTWYNFTVIFQSAGTCTAYLNNASIGSVAGTALLNATTTFAIGTHTHYPEVAFNGYIDDLKIYNYAITFSPLVSLNSNYTVVAGQYVVATSASGPMVLSSNSGASYSNVSGVTSGSWSGLAMSSTGQYLLAAKTAQTGLMPNMSSLASSSWTYNGVNWTCSASSVNPGYNIYAVFDNLNGDAWVSDNVNPKYNMDGTVNSTAASTTVLGSVGVIRGEWVQLTSSVPVTMYNFAFGKGVNTPFSIGNFVKTYYIIGSNDGTNWYPLQSGTTTDNNVPTSSSYILVNYTGTQTLTGASSGTIATVSYPYSNNAYTQFRLVGTSLTNASNGASYMEIGEWYINFVKGGQSYSSDYGVTWNNVYSMPAVNALSVSTNGQYALAASGQALYIVSAGFSALARGTSSSPSLAGINANITGTAVSSNGTYQLIVTSGSTNNVYYSLNSGASFTSMTVGSSGLVSCTMSADGASATVTSASNVYALTLGSTPTTQNYTLEWRSIGNGTLPMKASTTVPAAGIVATAGIQSYTLPAGSYSYTATIENDSNDWCDVTIVNNATNAVISTIVAAANDPPWGQRGPFSNSFVLSAQTNISIRFSNGYYMYSTGVYMTMVGTVAASNPVYTDMYAAVLADAFKCTSDRTLKKNIVTLDGALDKLDDLKGIYHGWIQQEHSKREVGVIAQDVQKVYPELVVKCGNGYLSVDYPKFTAVLLQSVKELKAKVLEIAAKRKAQ